MGTSTDGILAYGYDLGGDEEWKIAEANEYGGLTLPWFDAEDDDADFVTAAEKRLLVAAGFTETDWRVDGYYQRQREAKAGLGVELEMYCHHEFTMHVLATKVITAKRGDCKPIDFDALQRDAIRGDWDDKLRSSLAVLGITPKQEKPAWLLCSYWG